jgi:hypothetical protein
VKQCVEEIERRGMEEVGIYRVSGVATDIQALKGAFDANNKDVSVMMSFGPPLLHHRTTVTSGNPVKLRGHHFITFYDTLSS